MEFKIKPYGIEGIELVQSLAHKIWWSHYPSVISPKQIEYMLEINYSKESLRSAVEDKKCVFYLVFQAEEALGYVVVSPNALEENSYFIHKFYLDTQEHNKGLGTQVFKAILNAYPTAKIFRLGVNRQNFKSINFYFKNGFKIEKCLDTDIGNGYVMDDFIMVFKRL